MNKKKRYILEDIDEGEFKLISIHSNCEDFKLAYLINLTCNSRFIKLKKKVYENGSKVEFQIFEWIDIARGICCYLFSNRSLSFKDVNVVTPIIFIDPEIFFTAFKADKPAEI